MLEWLLVLISRYRYLALFGLLAFGIIGLPVPDEMLMAFTGYLTSLPPDSPAHMDYVLTIAVTYAGSMSGMTFSYWIGRTFGRSFLDKYGKWLHLGGKRLERAEKWFRKYGVWTVSFGYWIPGVRHFTCYLAGMSGVGFVRYLLYAGSGAFVWCVTFVTLGRTIGANWQQAVATVHRYAGWCVSSLLLLAVAVAIGVFAFRRRRRIAR